MQCALVYWLTARLASRNTALGTVILYFAYQVANLSMVTAQHRWDSSTLALLSIALVFWGWEKESARRFAVAGAISALTPFFTPSLGLLSVVTVGWLLLNSAVRRYTLPYVLGGLGTAGLCLAVMAAEGILAGFLEQLLWLSRHYSGVNIMAYGSIIGGYQALFEGVSGVQFAVRGILILWLVLPAVLPVIALRNLSMK